MTTPANTIGIKFMCGVSSTRVYVYVCVSMSVCIGVCAYMCVYVCVCKRMCVCVYSPGSKQDIINHLTPKKKQAHQTFVSIKVSLSFT